MKKTITIVYYGRDGGWWKVMRNGNCVEDFRDRREAEKFAQTLNNQ